MDQTTRPKIGYLLTRDRHVVPITGLAPDDIKAGLHAAIRHPGSRLKHAQGLTATVKSLGFRGDFGDYQHKRYPLLLAFMERHGLREYRHLFDVPPNDLFFNMIRFARRALADRLFYSNRPMPRRVFLGSDYDWDLFPRLFLPWTEDDFGFQPTDLASARRWISGHGTELVGVHNFLGDQLLDLPEPGETVVKIYSPLGAEDARATALSKALKVMDVLRWVIDQEEPGWVDILGSPDVSVGQFVPRFLGSAGHRPPNLSRPRAIRGSGEWKPNAIRCRSRSFVFTDSTRAFVT